MVLPARLQLALSEGGVVRKPPPLVLGVGPGSGDTGLQGVPLGAEMPGMHLRLMLEPQGHRVCVAILVEFMYGLMEAAIALGTLSVLFGPVTR